MHLRLLGLFFINYLSYQGYMLQIVTEFCLLHLTASHAGCKYFFLSSKVNAENFSRRYICVCIATAVDFSIQVQMNQWKIVWLPVWMNLMYY